MLCVFIDSTFHNKSKPHYHDPLNIIFRKIDTRHYGILWEAVSQNRENLSLPAKNYNYECD